MRTRLVGSILTLTALAAIGHAQLPGSVSETGVFPDLGQAVAYVAALRYQWAFIGLESYVHSRTTKSVTLESHVDPRTSELVQTKEVTFKVDFFARDGATAPLAPVASGGPRLKAAAIQTAMTAYVTDQSFNAVRSINPLDGSILATVQLPANGSPVGLAVTPDGKFLWVCEGFLAPAANTSVIEIIDTATFQVAGSIPLGSKVAATYIAMTPDGSTAYVVNDGLVIQGDGSGAVNSILILDVASQKVTGQLLPPLINPQRPTFGSAVFDRIAISPDGTLLYATSSQGIFVFDTLTNTQINPPSSALAIVNIPTFNVTGITPTPDEPILFHPNGARAYFTSVVCPSPNSSNSCLAVMDTKTNQIVDAVPLGPASTTHAGGLGISPDGTWVVVKEFSSGDWILIDTTTDKVVNRLPGESQTDTVFFKVN
jgi:DNA-binding beta-propeller fold protein YncE